MTTQILDRNECMRLLASQQVGRLAVVAGHYPLVVPVNFVLEHGSVMFRSAAGVKLEASSHRNVSFQVDEIDVVRRRGWSVLLTGFAEIVTDRSRGLPIEPFDEHAAVHWVRISTHDVSGRRITPADFVSPLDDRGYL